MFGKRFKGKQGKEPENDTNEDAEMEWDEKKTAYMETLLGKQYDMVMHALIPFAVGGGLDLYYFPNGIPGTAIATKELVDSDGNGPSNRIYPAYELIMFTKQELNLDKAKDANAPFGAVHKNISGILNPIARYSAEATLNPKDTAEFPKEMKGVGGKCIIFDGYSPVDKPGPKGMGLMLIMEVFRSEMTYAREDGCGKLIQMLMDVGHYPYTDLDREPVI